MHVDLLFHYAATRRYVQVFYLIQMQKRDDKTIRKGKGNEVNRMLATVRFRALAESTTIPRACIYASLKKATPRRNGERQRRLGPRKVDDRPLNPLSIRAAAPMTRRWFPAALCACEKERQRERERETETERKSPFDTERVPAKSADSRYARS